jgi:muramoyltetrapeptide carboxypeptidase LdcA involved in peptidoglycan recycling
MMKDMNEIRVIAPSFSREPGCEQRDEQARQRLESIGYTVTFSKHIDDQFHLGTARADDRIEDFHEAIADPNVTGVIAYSGGWSANELLPLIDWDLVRANPKPLFGYSDITVLLNAIYAKSGVVGYLGPNFGSFGWQTSWQYTLNTFREVIHGEKPIELEPSNEWSETDGSSLSSTSWRILQEGDAEARLLGGNFNTFHLLQGTEYQPRLDEPFILIAEDDDESKDLTARYFSRRLESILQLPGARDSLKGIIIGRFQTHSQFSASDIDSIIESKKLGNIPVVADLDFGHTVPTLTLPIGGKLKMTAKGGSIALRLMS